MAYDKKSWTYRCDKCGCEMIVDYEHCTEELPTLRCNFRTKECTYHLIFKALTFFDVLSELDEVLEKTIG